MRTDIPWRKSSFSAETGNCMELASSGGIILMRESDDPDVVIRMSAVKLRAFLESAKTRTFDGLG